MKNPFTTAGPFIHFRETDDSSMADWMFGLSHSNLRCVVRRLRGNRMVTVGGLFDEFAAALQFPYYFGANWDALDECLCDLEWLQAGAYILVLSQANALLREAEPESLKILLRTLDGAAKFWSGSESQGAHWRSGPLPFHLVLHDDRPLSPRIGKVHRELFPGEKLDVLDGAR